jgi:hypothetical protein
MNTKKGLAHEESTKKISNCSHKIQNLSKSNLHFKSYVKQAVCTKHETNNKYLASSQNSTMKAKNTHPDIRKAKVKKFIYNDKPEDKPGMKLLTENSSLSCSTFKNIRMNYSVPRNTSKNQSHFHSI